MTNDMCVALSMVLFAIITFLTIMLIGETILILASTYSPPSIYYVFTLTCLSLWGVSLRIVIQDKETNTTKIIY